MRSSCRYGDGDQSIDQTGVCVSGPETELMNPATPNVDENTTIETAYLGKVMIEWLKPHTAAPENTCYQKVDPQGGLLG